MDIFKNIDIEKIYRKLIEIYAEQENIKVDVKIIKKEN